MPQTPPRKWFLGCAVILSVKKGRLLPECSFGEQGGYWHIRFLEEIRKLGCCKRANNEVISRNKFCVSPKFQQDLRHHIGDSLSNALGIESGLYLDRAHPPSSSSRYHH